jgi:hypothetical protein
MSTGRGVPFEPIPPAQRVLIESATALHPEAPEGTEATCP